ncbi:MAG TPA: M56 family metallopeptidase [Pyrinomonadaceae bacterium]|jgi:beta-lactamase regulating signal transducer with metallopeptidase domain|nr:M56 family metallopeptidase [Pyrinomonadaceae bacterium]
MRISSQLLLTFLLNACWQIALIAALASFGSWLLRNSVARYQHWIWVSALCLAFFVPAFTSSQTLLDTDAPTISAVPFVTESMSPLSQESVPNLSGTQTALPSTFLLNQTIGFSLLAIYFGFILFRIFNLAQAWQTTRAIKRDAAELEPDDRVAEVIHRCELEFGTSPGAVRVFRSETLPVPVTIGLTNPVIILPELLLHEGNVDLLTSAIGHEFIHVARRDYLLNLFYELLFVPISFHPAAALLRRRVKQTRELCCDGLVAERILNAEVYARSLVRLAGSAPPLRRLSVTTTVGIADADILEARIMSLLKKPEMNTRSKKLLLVAVALLLAVPCFAAAALAMRFDVETNAQDPAAQEKERKEKEVVETKMRRANEMEEMKVRMAQDPAFREEMERKQKLEMEMREVRQAALIRLARINMDQAIQIATSQTPGKVLLCSLDAKGWEEPGKLAKDGLVFYHVMIANEGAVGATHIWVNAIDGTIIKAEKELPRKPKPPEQ